MSSSSFWHYFTWPSFCFSRDPTIQDQGRDIRTRKLYTVIWAVTMFFGLLWVFSIAFSFWESVLLVLLWALASVPAFVVLDQISERLWGKEFFYALDAGCLWLFPSLKGGSGNPDETYRNARKNVYNLVSLIFYIFFFLLAAGCCYGLWDSIELHAAHKLVVANLNETRVIELSHQQTLIALQPAVLLNTSYEQCLKRSVLGLGLSCTEPEVNETVLQLQTQASYELTNMTTLKEALVPLAKKYDELLKRTWWDNYSPWGVRRRLSAHAKINREIISDPLAIIFGICAITAIFITVLTWSYRAPNAFESDADLFLWIVMFFAIAAFFADLVYIYKADEYKAVGNEIANQMLSPAWQAFIELGKSPFMLTCAIFTHDPYSMIAISFSSFATLAGDIWHRRKMNMSALLTSLFSIVALDIVGRSLLSTTIPFEWESLTDTILKGIEYAAPATSPLLGLIRSRRKQGATA